MKVNVKTLKGTLFEIEVKLEDTVADVKKNIETVQGPDVYPAAQQMLIHQGKVLKDNTSMEENEVSENSFMVIMLSKVTAPVAAPPPAQPPTSTTNPPSDNPYNQAASHLVEGINLPGVIHRIVNIGGGTWDRDTVVRALHAAFNNPERAFEYLYSGIPDHSPHLSPLAGAPPQAAQPPPPTEPNANTLNLFPQGLPAGAGGNLDFLPDSSQFEAVRSRIRADPRILPPMLRELERQNPQLRRLIRERRAEFFGMIFDRVEGNIEGRPASRDPESFRITRADLDALNRLEAMVFNSSVVSDAFFACDKNEEMAANYLLDHMHENEE